MATQDDSFPDPMEAAQRILQERAGGGTPSPAAPTVAEPQGGPGGEAAPAGLPAASERPGRWAVNPITGKEARLPDPEPGLPQGPLDAILTGTAKAALETKDFLTGGNPTPGTESSFRQNVDATSRAIRQESTALSLVETFTQFGVGMLGANKLKAAGALVPGLANAGKTILTQGGRIGKTLEFSGKAAAVGAVVFDPHEERLSNIIQSVPALRNPVTGFLEADKEDNEYIGRMKAALESIGMDKMVLGIVGGVKWLRAGRRGDQAGMDTAAKEVEQSITELNAPPAEVAPANSVQALDGEVLPQAPTQTPSFILDAYRPAVRVNGKLYEGSSHASAVERAAGETGESYESLFGRTTLHEGDAVEGYIAGDGKFITSKDANSLVDAHAANEAANKAVPVGGATPREALSDTGVPPKDASISEPAPLKAESVEQVQNPTDAGAPPRQALPPEMEDAALNKFLADIHEDVDALTASGGWQQAISDMHVFGKAKIPWQKLGGTPNAETGETALDAFIARFHEANEQQFNAMKGGDIMSDAKVDRMVAARARMWGEDPAALVGMLQSAGKDAPTLAANMEASFLLAQRAMQDTYSMAARINAGFLDEWGGNREAALAQLKEMLSLSTGLFGSAQSIKANAGRALRRMRGEFRLDPQDVRALEELDGEQLMRALADSNGNPRALAMIARPGLWEKGMDAFRWVHINSLLSSPMSVAFNLLSNAAIAIERPLERAIGSYWVGGEQGKIVRQQALRSYYYMGASLTESWRTAMKAWNAADSILTPHGSELQQATGVGTQVALADFKPLTSIPNMVYNMALMGAKAVGAPGRINGAADEFFKSAIYRANVMADAQTEALQKGLTGADLRTYMENRLMNAFDAKGAAVDLKAISEARQATFQQDLLPGTFGKAVYTAGQQSSAVRVILPFIKTPTNLVRTGWKMTPGLNMLQTEYREMISGRMGPQAQAQAIGQMSMGTLMSGTIGYLATQGYMTGGPPKDPNTNKALQNTGWRPYSVVIPGENGTKTYVPFNRLDPIGMVFGIAADIADVIQQDPDDTKGMAEQMAFAMTTALAKNITNKTYLRNLNQALEGLLDPEDKGPKTAGGIAAGFIPFSSAMRFGNPDPYMRDARGFVDKLKATVPGFSEQVPPVRDAWGDPVTVHKGFWVGGSGSVVDAEVRRMGEDEGVQPSVPSPTVEGGVDLREVLLSDGKTNAYERYQELSRQPTPRVKPIKDVVEALMRTPAYAKAPDGDSSTKGTKLWMIAGAVSKYREVALKMLKVDPVVRQKILEKQMKVQAAYAAQRPNPTRANKTQQLMDSLSAATGVDLNSVLPPAN